MKVSVSDEEGTILVSHTVDASRIMQAVIQELKYCPLTHVGQMRVVIRMLREDPISNLEDDLATLILRGEK